MAVEAVWVKQDADTRGYTSIFKCSECGMIVHLYLYAKECEFPYCPFCRAEMIGTEDENEDN